MLVVDEVERELVAVAREEPPRAQGVALSRLEHVAAHDPDDAPPQRVRIAEPESAPAARSAPTCSCLWSAKPGFA